MFEYQELEELEENIEPKNPILMSLHEEPNFHSNLSPGLFILKPELSAVVYPLLKFVHYFDWRKVAVLYPESFLDESYAMVRLYLIQNDE
jgi:hypothetical protein